MTPDYRDRYLQSRMQLADTKAALGNVTHALLLACKALESEGHDVSHLRTAAKETEGLRYE